MPAGFNQATSDIETVVGVQFSIKSPDEIEKGSVVEIVTQATFEGNEPKIGGLFDPRMGVLENGKICRSCGQTNHGCPGHFGHFRLTRPVYFIQFHEKIMNILRCVCIRCAKLKIDKNLRSTIMAKKEENRWRDVLKACSAISRCGQEIEDGCGATQPSKYERKGIANIVAHFPADGEKEAKEQMLEVEYVHRLFRRISDEDVDFMGFSRFWCRPDWMICTILPIPPPQMRPSVVQDNNTRSEDDLTHKLFEIIKSDRILQEKIDRNSPKSTIDEHANIVQYHVATLVDNQIPGVAPSAQRSGRPLKSIQQRIGSKEGRIRYNIQGKRVEFSARSVITPDPNLSIDELGVPLEIATNLTFPERVTVYNRDKLYKLVQNGADIYPGAKTVVKPDGRMISLKHVNTKEIVLYNGDIVNRHLLDGDIVLFNRQPTLHKMSMMAHRVKVLPGKTFRLNVLVTRPYNADFDGDEMNMHCPQSYEAATELEEIAAIPHNIVTPRHAKPLIGVFQDSVVGSYRLTRASNEFTRREFMNLMMRNKRFEGIMPLPNAANRYTGKQVLSQLLPALNLEMGNKGFDEAQGRDGNENFVRIKQGEIKQGQIDSSVYMSSGKGIIHTLYNDYGPKDTSMFLDSLQRVVEDYLVLDGFSVGISDLVADDETAKSIQKVIEDCKKKIEEIQFQVHTDIFENNTGKTNQQEFEDQAFGFLKQATSTASSAVKKSLSPENRLVAMINSGSKGDWVNIAQMIACLGQQAIENKRIAYGFTDRTLPHYKKYDDGAEARGFIDSSFIKGLTPQQFFFHAMSGREGLIDTAVKTAETGYIQRQLIKAMEDIVVQHDGTVRDANMNVVQFYYGEDGIMATKLESQSLPLDTKLSREDIKQQFGLKDVDWSTVLKGTIVREQEEETVLVEAFVEQVLEDQRILIEEMYQGSMYSGSVNAPVNLSRLILNVKTRFNLDPKAETDLTPTEVLQRIPLLIERTESSHVRIWCALLRCYLAPHKLIVKERFTKDAFDALCELIVVGHMKSWVQPGEQVGIIAAQSIGEPSTQLTLNSVDWDERIIIAKDGKVWTPQIGEFIDTYESQCDARRIQHLENEQIYIDLKGDGHEWKALSCDENGTMQWTTLEAITKHPVVNEDGTDTILEVELESGKTIKATKGKSFLTVTDGKLLATNGSDLRVGDELPCAVSLALNQIGQITALPIRDYLSPTEWLYGSEMKKALTVMKEENAKGNRHWFQANQGSAFTIPYSRSDSFREAFLNGKNPHDIQEGFVYPKFVRREPTQIPATVPLDEAFGFFCGAYLAEGMSNKTQINITNNDAEYLNKVRHLMDMWAIGTHRVEGAKHALNTDIKGYTTSLIIHSTLLAKLMGTAFGNTSYKKDIPDWVLQAPDEFVKALVDGYISGDGCVHLNGTITYSSASEALITKMNLIMARYGIFTTMSKRMPALSNFKSVSMQHYSYIGQQHTTLFAMTFPLSIEKKQQRLQEHFESGEHKCMRYTLGDTMIDKIKTIREIRPLKEKVYDLTVEKTRNFVLLNTVNCADTFHLAGVASKSNVNQGIPRLREILKVTKNPKATSLLIYMKPEFRHNKEKARELVQDLELTLLRSITNKVAIYWDPTDEDTVVAEDRDLLNFYNDIEPKGDKALSKWLLRLELNREEMFNKNISMADVVFVIKMMYENDVNTVYSDYNADKLVMRIRITEGAEQDDFTHLKKFQSKLLNQCVIRGVPGIKAVTFREDKQKVEVGGPEGRYSELQQYVLDTDGSNYVKVMNHPLVDANRLYTTNIHDIMDILGLEAVRAILIQELIPIFGEDGVNYRHLGMLCDYITRSGRLMSIDRYGINKNDVGPLGKMSFEETSKIVMNAAMFGEVDPVTGVSANIMMGQPIRGGTAFSQILLDDAMLEQLTKGLEAVPEEEEELDGDLSQFEQPEDTFDPCGRTQFQMNMMIPESMDTMEDEAPIDLYVKGTAEAITAELITA